MSIQPTTSDKELRRLIRKKKCAVVARALVPAIMEFDPVALDMMDQIVKGDVAGQPKACARCRHDFAYEGPRYPTVLLTITMMLDDGALSSMAACVCGVCTEELGEDGLREWCEAGA